MDEENLGSDTKEADRATRSPWYLGIDIGTTALAASLFNAETGQHHVIAWVKNTPQGQLSLAALPSGLHSFKPYLNVAIPYLSPITQQWEPLMLRFPSGSWNESPAQHSPLIEVQQQLTTLLATLKADSNLSCTAAGLDDSAFQAALQHLVSIVVNQPVGASDAYRFNLREAVLAAELVSQPENIFFVEEVVAVLLAELHQPSQTTAVGATLQQPIPVTGGVLVISAGATTTELALAQAPQAGGNLTRPEVQQRRFPYAGNAIDQDIICQLIYPTTSDWDDLSLGNLVPLPGEPDLEARYALQQQLEGSLHGQKLLSMVREIKPSLCQQDVEAIAESSQPALKHEDFYSWVLSSYLQQLNRELNFLLSQSGMTADQIQRIVCAGGTGSIPTIAQWLQQKFSQAQVVQSVPNLNGAQFASDRVAQGLALLPRFPQILDSLRHQYSDYFLLRELLKAPIQTNESLSASQILQRLEQQGVNVAVCKSTLVSFLDGQLPIGLVPSKATALLITSSQTADYQALTAAPLFSRQDHHYRLNHQQRDRLWHHLQTILAQTHQTLEASLTVGLKEAESSPRTPTTTIFSTNQRSGF